MLNYPTFCNNDSCNFWGVFGVLHSSRQRMSCASVCFEMVPFKRRCLLPLDDAVHHDTPDLGHRSVQTCLGCPQVLDKI